MPKGVYDRASSSWTPPPRAEYPPELVARVRDLYSSGLSMRETAAAGTTVKVLQRLMPRHGIGRRPAIKRDQTGPANSSWRGDEATYGALHLRVSVARGRPQRCSGCDTEQADRYEWANMTGNYQDVHDYVRLCVPCHRRFDDARRQQTGAPTSPPR